jgi:hypothetical protein
VTTVDGDSCQGTSLSHPVFVDFCAGSEVSPSLGVFPARLVKSASSSTGYYLYFQRLDSLDGFNFYEGNIGAWYSHAGSPGNRCNLAATDLGTGEMRAEISPSAGDHYYLVTAFGGGAQGPSGFASSGMEIPRLQSSCPP